MSRGALLFVCLMGCGDVEVIHTRLVDPQLEIRVEEVGTAEEQTPQALPEVPKTPPEKKPKEKQKKEEKKQDARAAQIAEELAKLDMSALSALEGRGLATERVLENNHVPSGLLDDAGRSAVGGGSGQITRGAGGSGLADIGEREAGDRKVKGPASKTDIELVSVDGGLATSTIRSALNRSLRLFRACHQAALKKHPGLAGVIELRFTVNDEGRVRFGKREDAVIVELSQRSLTSCVMGVLRGLSIKVPDGGGEVRLSISFSVP